MNMNIFIISARTSVPGIWGTSLEKNSHVESMFEGKKDQIMSPEEKIQSSGNANASFSLFDCNSVP